VPSADEADFAVVRLKPDGFPDLTFSGDGRMTFSVADDDLQDVAVEPNGSIVAAGQSDQNGLAVFRITPAGRLDHEFSGDGKAGDSSVDTGAAVAVQSDGRVVVAGDLFGTDTFAVDRFTAKGALDATFDHDGKRVIAMPGPNNPRVNDVAVDSHGRIVVATSTGNAGDSDIDVIRLLPNGAFDHSFSGDGKVALDFGTDDRDPFLAIQSNDEIVVGSDFTVPGDDGEMGLVRIAADGNLDTTFAGDGRRIVNPSSDREELGGLALQPNRAIVLTGESGSSGDTKLFVLRIGAGGKPDLSFGGGEVLLNPASGTDGSGGVAVGGSRILVGGTADDGSTRAFYAARLFE
ncbi:MAG TPA: hypothetical protein VNN79_17735, partial [Actinomycetota bacterium]|nr:hypothetical protein [Actinomycetota bacterium]